MHICGSSARASILTAGSQNFKLQPAQAHPTAFAYDALTGDLCNNKLTNQPTNQPVTPCRRGCLHKARQLLWRGQRQVWPHLRRRLLHPAPEQAVQQRVREEGVGGVGRQQLLLLAGGLERSHELAGCQHRVHPLRGGRLRCDDTASREFGCARARQGRICMLEYACMGQ